MLMSESFLYVFFYYWMLFLSCCFLYVYFLFFVGVNCFFHFYERNIILCALKKYLFIGSTKSVFSIKIAPVNKMVNLADTITKVQDGLLAFLINKFFNFLA